ncbi:MAG: hypothetical protein JW881_00325 [Spirochaetales bacterium]|nr:hypothetical protein [Spirochaetales bacterium]
MNKSHELQSNLEILKSSHAPLSDSDKKLIIKTNQAIKRMWREYLESAERNNLLNDNGEIVYRLRELESENFRSALSECIACWFFDKKLKLKVFPKPAGRNNRVLDMDVIIEKRKVGIEVKAPYRKIQEKANAVDHSAIIGKIIKKANRQFTDETPNILVIVPSGYSFYTCRLPLIKALLGKQMITFEIYNDTGSAVGETGIKTVLDGRFTKPIKEDSSPGYTRISAIIVIESWLKEYTIKIFGRYFLLSYKMKHNIVVLHNPFAKQKISTTIFKKWPQLIVNNDHMI